MATQSLAGAITRREAVRNNVILALKQRGEGKEFTVVQIADFFELRGMSPPPDPSEVNACMKAAVDYGMVRRRAHRDPSRPQLRWIYHADPRVFAGAVMPKLERGGSPEKRLKALEKARVGFQAYKERRVLAPAALPPAPAPAPAALPPAPAALLPAPVQFAPPALDELNLTYSKSQGTISFVVRGMRISITIEE